MNIVAIMHPHSMRYDPTLTSVRDDDVDEESKRNLQQRVLDYNITTIPHRPLSFFDGDASQAIRKSGKSN